MFDQGKVFGWRMSVQGSRERILDSVLPHEVSHTIFATHFRRPLPRWADEGACTTVEHASERSKQHTMLVTFLKTGRGIPFDRMFAMKEYPHDVMPLYSQGYSTARYLIAQGGPAKVHAVHRDRLSGRRLGQGHRAALRLHRPWRLAKLLARLGPRGKSAECRFATCPGRLVADAQPAAPVRLANSAEEYRPGGTSRLTASAPPAPPQASMASVKPSDERLRDPNRGWYARTSRGPAAQETEAPIRREATHPQPIEPARQIILEWRRPE